MNRILSDISAYLHRGHRVDDFDGVHVVLVVVDTNARPGDADGQKGQSRARHRDAREVQGHVRQTHAPEFFALASFMEGNEAYL